MRGALSGHLNSLLAVYPAEANVCVVTARYTLRVLKHRDLWLSVQFPNCQ